MKLSKLIQHLQDIFSRQGELDCSVMVEIVKPVRLQVQDPITDVASNSYEVILIGPERFDPDFTEDTPKAEFPEQT